MTDLFLGTALSGGLFIIVGCFLFSPELEMARIETNITLLSISLIISEDEYCRDYITLVIS